MIYFQSVIIRKSFNAQIFLANQILLVFIVNINIIQYFNQFQNGQSNELFLNNLN